jgi:hypothetical protein
MKKLNITDLKDKEIIYIIPLNDHGTEMPHAACWGIVDMTRYRIRTYPGSYPIGNMGNGVGYNAYVSPDKISDKPLTLDQIKQEKLVWVIPLDKDGEKDHSFGVWCDVKPDWLERYDSDELIKFKKDKVDGYNVYLSPPKPEELII